MHPIPGRREDSAVSVSPILPGQEQRARGPVELERGVIMLSGNENGFGVPLRSVVPSTHERPRSILHLPGPDHPEVSGGVAFDDGIEIGERPAGEHDLVRPRPLQVPLAGLDVLVSVASA